MPCGDGAGREGWGARCRVQLAKASAVCGFILHLHIPEGDAVLVVTQGSI